MIVNAPPLVLIVDDNEDVREMYQTYLTYSGYRVMTAATGEDGLNAARTHRPHVILMDATMPGVDGWEATRQLKSDPALRHIPVLMLTAHAFPDVQTRAESAGCDGFVAKPCLPDELVEHVKSVLRSRS
ncbi:MAG TPA: response regulator [Vicinamibacterales bacterium]|nr:response regulator [Vicinamibacterales bacterium]